MQCTTIHQKYLSVTALACHFFTQNDGFFLSRSHDLKTKPTNQYAPCYVIYQVDGQPDIFLGSWTFKKSGPNRVIIIQKVKKSGCLFSFWVAMTRFFFTLVFFTPYFGPDIFQGRKPTHVLKIRIVGADWLDKCVAFFKFLYKL